MKELSLKENNVTLSNVAVMLAKIVVAKGQLIALLAALAPMMVLGACNSRQSDAPPPAMPEVATITVQPQRVVLTRELPGRTSAWLVAEVRPQVSGLIQKRLFDEGSDVEEGQALYQLDDAPFQAAMNNAKANLDAAKNSAKQARAALDASLAAVEQQEAVLELAKTNEQRFESLAGEGAVSLGERDQFVTEADVAEATMRSAQAQVNSHRQAIEVADAGIAQAEAALESARINLEYSKITAPISGRIGKSNVTVGSLVTSHQALTLTTIQQLDPIYVDVPQSYGELLHLRELLANSQIENDDGVVKQVRLILENGQTYSHGGTLEFRDVTVEQSTGSVLIRMVFPNPEGILLPGMFVRAVITEGIDPRGILVPQQAVSRDTKGRPVVMMLNEEGTVEQQAVKLDRSIGNEWLVSDGLTSGDKVIVEGMQRIRHGSEAKGVPFNQTEDIEAVADNNGDQHASTQQ